MAELTLNPNLTPWGRVIVAYMYRGRGPDNPPLTVGQLATKIGRPRQSVYNWVQRNMVPPLDEIFRVIDILGIPLSTVQEAYKAQDQQFPYIPAPSEAPVPKPYVPPIAEAPDLWNSMIHNAVAQLRDTGLHDDAALNHFERAFEEHVRHVRAGTSEFSRRLIEEHAVPKSSRDS
jgi:hypothetical protein